MVFPVQCSAAPCQLPAARCQCPPHTLGYAGIMRKIVNSGTSELLVVWSAVVRKLDDRYSTRRQHESGRGGGGGGGAGSCTILRHAAQLMTGTAASPILRGAGGSKPESSEGDAGWRDFKIAKYHL